VKDGKKGFQGNPPNLSSEGFAACGESLRPSVHGALPFLRGESEGMERKEAFLVLGPLAILRGRSTVEIRFWTGCQMWQGPGGGRLTQFFRRRVDLRGQRIKRKFRVVIELRS